MHTLLLLILVVHGLLHLIGFAKDGLGIALPGLTGTTLFAVPAPVTKALGVLWLIACLGLLVAALLFALRHPQWWLVACVAVLISQLLIVYAWSDAKFGTLPNLVIALVVVAAGAGARFDRDTAAVVQTLLAGTRREHPAPVRAEALVGLPQPVQRWLQGSGVVDRPRARIVRLEQRGAMKTSPNGQAMQARAEQYFTLDPPGFVWGVDVSMFGIPVVGRDSYLDGHGGMLIEACGLWPIVNARGDAIDQGTLLRFLGELVWFPSAALESYLRWEPIDDAHARVTMLHAGVEASAIFTFTPDGRVTEMKAQRFYTGDGEPRLEQWGDKTTEWQRFDGVLVPSKGEVFWDLKSGRFTYYTWQITALEYDPPVPPAP